MAPATIVLPTHIPPMLAQPAPLPRDAHNWAFEYKWDGARAVACPFAFP